MILYGTRVWKNSLGAVGDIVRGDMPVFVSHGPVRLVACSRVPNIQFTCRFEPDFCMVGDGGPARVRTTTEEM